MIETLSTYQAAGRLKCFTGEAAFAIIDFYERLEQDTGTPIEFDEIAIRSDWTEYASIEEWGRENRYIVTKHHSDLDSFMNDQEPEERDEQLKKLIFREYDQHIILDNGTIITGLF